MFTVKSVPLGTLETNCYYYSDGQTAVLVDVGACDEKFLHFLAEQEVFPSAILLTHGHFDHICGVADLLSKHPMPVYIGEGDAPCLENSRMSLAVVAPTYHQKPLPKGAEVHLVHDDQTVTVGTLTFEVMELPGHTVGGVGYYFAEDGALFIGDTVFRGNVGRTDFPGGSAETLQVSLMRLCNTLPKETGIYCGHGESTDLGYECAYNPYFKGVL